AAPDRLEPLLPLSAGRVDSDSGKQVVARAFEEGRRRADSRSPGQTGVGTGIRPATIRSRQRVG
ncbi:MAG TPA: hypothetical protein VLL74_00820, partial [Methanoregula sp.]|nr:hypothetical protein [Methanoregula sp.]